MDKMDLNRCTRCVMPETHETIFYDDEGVCSICRNHEIKQEKVDWKQKEKEFAAIIEEFKGTGTYDCLVPISGGKDSTYVLYQMIKKYNVHPLAVSFDHGFYRPHHIQNRDRVLQKLGVDFLVFRPNMKVIKKLMLESLIRKGDFCWHCHTGVFSWPMQIAIEHNVPLLIWGESTAEYTSYYDFENPEDQDEEAFNRYINLGINAQDMVGMLDGTVTMRDLAPYTYPKLKDLKRIGYRSICYGAYHKWDVRMQVDTIKKDLDWQVDQVEGIPEEYWYTKIECMMSGMRDYLKFIKRGFSRTSQLTTDDIRAGCLTREKAIEKIKHYDGLKPASLPLFLEFMDMTEDEFNDIILKHVVSPWVCDKEYLKNLPWGKELWDQKQWDLTGVDWEIKESKDVQVNKAV